MADASPRQVDPRGCEGLVLTSRRGGKSVALVVGLLGAWYVPATPSRIRALLELDRVELSALASMSHAERRAIARMRVPSAWRPTAWRHLANLHAWGYLRADLRRWTEQAHRAARVLRGGRP